MLPFNPPLAAELLDPDGREVPVNDAAIGVLAYGRLAGDPMALIARRTGEIEELRDVTRLRILDSRVTLALAEATSAIESEREPAKSAVPA